MYSDIVQVSDTVQRSINLEFDLHNQKQLENFVPTSSTCHVLKAYFKTALGYAHDNSVLLVGAYGRGKTFLALLLSELLDYRNHARLQPVLNKIAALDEELYGLLQEYAAKKMRLVPVVIRSGYDALNQSFLISLKKSLELEDLSQINPQTLFDMALTMLQSWQQETEELSLRLQIFLDQFQISLEGLEKGLKKQDSQALGTFRSLYHFMTFGMEFNPLISQDPIKAYEQALHDLESESIQGFFVILDEMSKLLDDSKEELQKKLKLIQDFAELANRSTPNHQVLFTCITHKSLGLYASQLDALTTSAFRTVEGRFKEIHIKHPPLEYLQLLSLSLNKKVNYLEIRDQFWQEHQELLDEILESKALAPDIVNFLKQNAFPIHPISVWALMILSSYYAQNERTIFTFLTDDELGSFQQFIRNNNRGIYTGDLLFDYFSSQIAHSDTTFYRRIQAALQKVNDESAKQIIKIVAILTRTQSNSSLSPSFPLIASLSGRERKEVQAILDSLLEKGILVKNFFDNNYALSTTTEWTINQRLSGHLSDDLSLIDFHKQLEDIVGTQYYLPHRYNLDYKMTRYFNVFHVEFKNLISLLPKVDTLVSNLGDGILLNVYVDSLEESQIVQIKEALQNLNTSTIVVRIIPSALDQLRIRLVERKEMVKIYQEGKLNRDELIQLSVSIQSLKSLLYRYIHSLDTNSIVFSFIQGEIVECLGDRYHIEQLLSKICDMTYFKTPKVNNEMLNRKKVNIAYLKASRTLISHLLTQEDASNFYKNSSTNPDATTYFSLFDQEGPQKSLVPVIEVIKDFFLDKTNGEDKFTLESLLNTLTTPPYGIREGLLPVLIALGLREVEAEVVLYFKQKEIILDGLSLEKVVANPTDYYFLLTPRTQNNQLYIEQLLQLYRIQGSGLSFYQKLEKIVEAMRKEINKEPTLIREANLNANFLHLPSSYLQFKKRVRQFDLNPYDLICRDLPKIFGSDLLNIPEALFQNQQVIQQSLSNFYARLADQLIALLPHKDPYRNLEQNFVTYTQSQDPSLNQLILNGREQNLAVYLTKLASQEDPKESMILSHDLVVLDQIAKILTGYFITDWSADLSLSVVEGMKTFLKEVANKQQEFQNNDSVDQSKNLFMESSDSFSTSTLTLSPFGEMLKNALSSSLIDFGDSISNEEKVNILQSLVEEVLTGELK